MDVYELLFARFDDVLLTGELVWIACIQAYCGADDADMKAAFPEFYQ